MSDFDVEHSVSSTLRARSAGQAVMQKCVELQDEAPARGRLARALGHSPLHPDAVAWYQGALGELETGRRLTALPAGYTVLHSLPIGDADMGADMGADSGADTVADSGADMGADTGADSGDDTVADSGADSGADMGADTGTDSDTDVDHLVIGPSGVFSLTTRHLAGKKVWVGVDSLSVNGIATDYVRTAEAEARRVSKRLSLTLQRVVPVTPLIVTVDESSLAIGATHPAVDVVSSRQLARWFAKRGPVLTSAEIASLNFAAEQPATWRGKSALGAGAGAGASSAPSPASLATTLPVPLVFEDLVSEVEAAEDRRRLVATGVSIVALLVTVGSASVILNALMPQLFAH